MALNKEKTDEKLGLEIHKKLLDLGIETPMIINENGYSLDEAEANILDHFEAILKLLGLDLSDDSLKKTPYRLAKMYVRELFWGLQVENFPKIMSIENKMKYDEMIIEKNIKVNSYCEHHFQNIIGKCHIGYIPNEKVLGLSKLNRVVEYFSRRPQVQERLTEQIYHALAYILDTENIAVMINADHFCVKCRGVEDINSYTLTSKLGGIFKEKNEVRQEFMNLIG